MVPERLKIRVCQQRALIGQVQTDATDCKGIHCDNRPADRTGPIRRVDDQLGNHRIVMVADDRACLDPGIEPHAGGRSPKADLARFGAEILGRVFGGDADFNGVPVKLHIALRQRQRLAPRDAQLPFDQIDAGDRLGHGVFHLQPGIHFQKVVFTAPGVIEVFHRPGGAIADRLRQPHRCRTHAVAHSLGKIGGGGFFDQLLVVALQRTIAVAQMQHGAVSVAQNLHFDVAGTGRIAFEEHRRIAEGALRFGPGRCNRFGCVAQIGDKPHPASAAAGAGLDQKGGAKRLGLLQQARVGLILAAIAGQDGHACGFGGSLGLDLGAHPRDSVGFRPDEHKARRLDRRRETGILRQKTIARVHRTRARRPRGLKDGLDVQITVRRGGPTDADGMIGLGHEGRVAVRVRKHRYAFQPQFAAPALDAPGNLAPVGDQNAGEAHFTRHDGTPLLMKLLMPSIPSSVSHASASRSAV